jgi:hypothetical protein
MTRHDTFIATLVARFGPAAIVEGSDDQPVVRFAARHPEVGDVVVRVPAPANNLTATIEIGAVLTDLFHDYDTHLQVEQRVDHLSRDVVRFLTHLFDDRLLFWTSADHGRGGWRERLEAPHTDPLVLDNCLYRTYLWSGPLGEWRTSTRVLARGGIASEREYEVLSAALEADGPCAVGQEDRRDVEALLRAYEREHRLGE